MATVAAAHGGRRPWMARAGDIYNVDTGDDEDVEGAIVPANHGNPGALLHPLTLSMGFGSLSSCISVL